MFMIPIALLEIEKWLQTTHEDWNNKSIKWTGILFRATRRHNHKNISDNRFSQTLTVNTGGRPRKISQHWLHWDFQLNSSISALLIFSSTEIGLFHSGQHSVHPKTLSLYRISSETTCQTLPKLVLLVFARKWYRSVDKFGRRQLSLIFPVIAIPPKLLKEFSRNIA